MSNTITELVLILLIIVLSLFYLNDKNNVNRQIYEKEKEKNKILSGELAKERNNSGDAKIIQVRKGLKSRQKPSCIEKGVAGKAVGTIIISGRNRFSCAGNDYKYNELEDYFKQELFIANKNDCCQAVNVAAGRDLSVDEYDEGLRKLEQIFYVKRLRVK